MPLLTIRLTDDQMAALRGIARTEQLSISDVVRRRVGLVDAAPDAPVRSPDPAPVRPLRLAVMRTARADPVPPPVATLPAADQPWRDRPATPAPKTGGRHRDR